MPKKIRPIRIEGNIAYVPLTRGYEAVIDAADVHLVEGWNWYANIDGNTIYAARKTPRKPGPRTSIIMHRAIMACEKDVMIDHRNGNGIDNTRGNLRSATNTQNQWNQNPPPRGSSRFRGVCWAKDTQKWQAQICIGADKKRLYLGQFANETDAASAYNTAALIYHGDFASINHI
jgi:AP2 domain